MHRQRLEKVTDFLKTQADNLEVSEYRYKVDGAERVGAHLNAFLEGTLDGKVNVQPSPLNLLSWQVVDGLDTMANTTPDVFRTALRELWTTPLDPKRADVFWATLDPALDVLAPVQRKHFDGAGTRASVASYFLFLADPTGYAFYRPSFAGRAVEWLCDPRDKLDRRSLGSLLVDFKGRCAYLYREFNDAGLGLKDMLDLQGALSIISTQYLTDARRGSQ